SFKASRQGIQPAFIFVRARSRPEMPVFIHVQLDRSNVGGEAVGPAQSSYSVLGWGSYSRADGPEHGRARSLPPGVRRHSVVALTEPSLGRWFQAPPTAACVCVVNPFPMRLGRQSVPDASGPAYISVGFSWRCAMTE